MFSRRRRPQVKPKAVAETDPAEPEVTEETQETAPDDTEVQPPVVEEPKKEKNVKKGK